MSKASARLGILASGGGSNLQAIIDSCAGGALKGHAEPAIVIANKPEAFALNRARKHDIPAVCLNRKEINDPTEYDRRLVAELNSRNVDLVCLAGYLLKLDPSFIAAFPHRIINIHPALLPKFGGKGMYGRNVHEAVLRAGEKESGATVHWVDEEFDHGSTILQRRVRVEPGDTVEALAARVLAIEHQLYPEAILKVITGGLS